ncbi:MAG: glycosyl transferase [Microbacterium sp.]
MRFVWAVVAFVLAAASFGLGLAQRTVFLGPDSVEHSVTTSEEAPYLVIDSSAFAMEPGAQTLTAKGEGELFEAYGTTADVEAWLSDQTYNMVTVDKDGNLTSTLVKPTVEANDGTEGRDPSGSDLWVDEKTADGELVTQEQLPEGMSMLVAVDGTQPAPQTVQLRWPLDQRTPWFGPLITLGGILVLVGIILYILAIRHTRSRRGPMRKSVAGPAAVDGVEEQPEQEALEPAAEDEAAVEEEDSEKTGGRTQRLALRRLLAIPTVGALALVAAGCTPDAWPDFSSHDETPTATPTPTATLNPDQPASTLTEAQADRIVADISSTVADADDASDADAAGDRLTGLALDARTMSYQLISGGADYAAPPAIPAGPADLVLPEATDGWPRTAIMIVSDPDDATAAPTIMTVTQADPWSNYKASYLGYLEADAATPDLAPIWLGAPLIAPDSPFLTVSPQDVPTDYADILANGEDSEYAALFDLDDDGFLTGLQTKHDDTTSKLNESSEGETASIEFGQAADESEPIALATLDSGAIVSVAVDDWETVKPTDPMATIQWQVDDGQPLDPKEVLTGETSSAGGVTTTYTDQLFFFVPAQGSDAKITLLGYATALKSVDLLEAESTDDSSTTDG